MEEDKIRISTSIPSLKNKIQTNISVDANEPVCWYIKFNIPLDESTVSEKTMDVTDTEGYIMRTDISYSLEKNMIVITPLDTYEPGIYYLLNISKKVKSLSGKKMKTKVHILFKLIGKQISEFKILKSNVEVPKPKPRPKEYDKMIQSKINTASRVYSFDEKILEKVDKDKLPSAELKINVLLGVLGILIMILFLILRNMIVLFIGLSVCIIGMGHIIIQLQKKPLRSVLSYNKGVRKFNSGKYDDAEICFKTALILDDSNELAEYALNKISYYK